MPRRTLPMAALLAATLLTTAAQAQVSIDQNKALAGNITPGDSAGFPITLSQPGSYKLTGNLNVPAGTTGVLITASNVSLDLNGFAIQGPNSCTRQSATRVVTCTMSDESTFGINAFNVSGTALRNGTVRGFAWVGIGLSGASRVDGLSVSHNIVGIQAFSDVGAGAVVQSSVVTMNQLYGVVLGDGLLANSRIANSGAVCVYGSGSQSLVSESMLSGCQTAIDKARIRGVLLFDHGANFGLNVVSMGGNNSGGNSSF